MKKLTTISIIQVQFPNNPINNFDIPKFRGSIAKQFPKYELIHNHSQDGKFRYGYPKIQFKSVNRIPMIIGIVEGVDILKEVFLEVKYVDIEGHRRKIWEKNVLIREEIIGQTENFINYRFMSSWMALKEENYETYKNLDLIEQQVFLKHLLRENLKTLSKGFGYHIPDIDSVKVEGYFKPRIMNFKNVKMVCFNGEFTTNFLIPDYLGIGKQVARGYGTVKRVNR